MNTTIQRLSSRECPSQCACSQVTWADEHKHTEILEWIEARRNVAERCPRVPWVNEHKYAGTHEWIAARRNIMAERCLPNNVNLGE